MFGGVGDDVLCGGKGGDVFVFAPEGGRDRIVDFDGRGCDRDTLDLSSFGFDVTAESFGAWKAYHVRQVGKCVVIDVDETTSVELSGTKATTIGFDDFLF